MNIQVDKILHFLAGYGICATSLLFAPAWLALLIVLIFGATKELYDLKVKQTYFDVLDLVATVAGGAAFAVAVTIAGAL